MRKSIAAILESEPRFTIFLSIIKLAGLYETLNSEQEFTVLAPGNDAFEKLTAPVYARIINEDRKKLRRIMEYHILPGKHKLQEFDHGSKQLTLNGNDVNISVINENIKVNESNIIKGDKVASNGIMHMIDSVL